MTDKRKKLRKYEWAAFILYVMLMIFLLFIMRIPVRTVYLQDARADGYWKTVWSSTNLVPFSTVIQYLRTTNSFSLTDHAFVNNAGNIVMFVPCGVLLPELFRGLRSFGPFILTMLATILMVEIIQVLTLVGACDIDDLILNLTGCAIGYLIYKSIVRYRTKHEKSG